MAGAAQLITISALAGADPPLVTCASLLLAIAPVLLAAAAALAPAPANLLVAVAGIAVLAVGIVAQVTHTGLFFGPAQAARAEGRARPVRGVDRVIVGTSGSPGSLRALRYGETLARAHEAVLIPVIAWTPPGGDRADWTQPSGFLRQQWRDLACQQLRAALIAVWGEVPDDSMVQPHIERGPAGWVLVNLASHAGDLLLVGAGRRGALARMTCSRVSRYCVARARCPVLTIPPPDLARELRLAWMLRHWPLTPERVLRDQDTPGA